MPRRTSSSWGSPPARHWRFLRFVETRNRRSGPPSFLVVGCADGKFVLPAARRKWTVAAIDVDSRMLFGCPRMPELGIDKPVPGLVSRLASEELTSVAVILGDFMDSNKLGTYDAVWTSGSLQYSFNSKYDIQQLTGRLRELLVPSGIAFIEFMLPDTDRLAGRPNCPCRRWWQRDFPHSGWTVLRCSFANDEVDNPHPYLPTRHTHSWGRILAVRSA